MIIKSYSKLVGLIAIVSGFVLMIMMLFITTDSLSTFVYQPLPATMELQEMAMVVIVSLTFAYTQATGAHLKLELLSSRLSPRGQAMLESVSIVVGLALVTGMMWLGWEKAISAWETNELMAGVANFPFFPAKIILVFGIAVFWGQMIIDLIQNVQQIFSPTAVTANSSVKLEHEL